MNTQGRGSTQIGHDVAPAPIPTKAGTVVIGGGIAGTSAAYHLAKVGEDVTLLERGTIGGGATSGAVGVFSPPLRQPFHETIRLSGADAAKEIWQFAERSTEGLATFLMSRGAEEVTELDLSGGYILAEAHSLHEVEDALQALQAAGLPVEWMDAADVRALLPSAHGLVGAIKILRGGSLAPAPATRSLAEGALEQGALVMEGVEVLGIVREAGEFRVETNRGMIRCKRVVHATHVDVRKVSPFLKSEVVPIRGQGFRTAPLKRVFRGSFATHWKLNIWRQDAEGRLLVSGWRHDAWTRSYGKESPEVDKVLQRDLARWFETTFPDLGPFAIRHRWSGIFGWTADYLPLVGAIPGSGADEYVTAGYSGGGLPFAFEAGRTVAALVAGTPPPVGSTNFDPARFDR